MNKDITQLILAMKQLNAAQVNVENFSATDEGPQSKPKLEALEGALFDLKLQLRLIMSIYAKQNIS